MDEKVYTPEVITENPFPTQNSVIVTESSGESGGVYSNATTNDKPIVRKRIATELLSTALNTRSKRILQEFELQQSGGFRIGNYKEGITGEISITPEGIITKDKNGLTTVAIYGEDGSGVFKGTIQAGSFVAGTLYLGSEAGNVYIDGEAQQIIINDGENDRVLIGYGKGLF